MLTRLARWFGYGPTLPPGAVVVRDTPRLVEDLRIVLAQAPRRQVPGLQRAIAQAEASARRTDDEVLAAWVRREVGADPALDVATAVHRLRERHPALAAGDAHLLVLHARSDRTAPTAT